MADRCHFVTKIILMKHQEKYRNFIKFVKIKINMQVYFR